MDLPSAADSIVSSLNEIKQSLAETLEKLDGVTHTTAHPLYERLERLEAEIRGNSYRDFIRQEVQNHNDQVLDQKISKISTEFQHEIERLEQRIDDPSAQYKIQAAPASTEQTIEDKPPNPDPQTKSNAATKRPPKGSTAS
jgi:exonuclease VII large subunit